MSPAILLLALTPALAADTTYLYETEGADTVAAEMFHATADGVRGRIVVRRPDLREATYIIRTGADGLPSSVTVEWRVHEAEGVRVEASFTARIEGTTLFMVDGSGVTIGEYPVPADAMPTVGRRPIAYGMLDVLARATTPDASRAVNLLVGGRAEALAATLIRQADTFRLETPELRIEATLDDGGLSIVTTRLIAGGSLRTFVARSGPRFDLDAFRRAAG